jgi:putative transposase
MLALQELEKAREERGLMIAKAKEAQVSRIDDSTCKVLSQSGNGAYLVSLSEDGWVCECLDYKYRAVKCKHIFAVEISIKLKEQVRRNVVLEEVSVSKCLFCHSENLKKFGLRHNRDGDIQRFVCGGCGRTFSVNIGFEKMKHNPQAVTSAMQLYFSGESLRNTMKSLRLLGVEVSHQTVYDWITKYITLMKEYVETLTPNVSDTWRADELYVKIKGDMKYLFALMDDETRFWIAQEVAGTKYKHDARNLFRMGKELMRKKPLTIITDDPSAYHEAYKREFWTTHSPRTVHVQNITIRGDRNNNKMERMNGEVRDREKVVRGIKKKNTPILKGYQVFHNYIRGHEGLDGKTPAEACGITIKGNNKWKTLIQNAKLSTESL